MNIHDNEFRIEKNWLNYLDPNRFHVENEHIKFDESIKLMIYKSNYLCILFFLFSFFEIEKRYFH